MQVDSALVVRCVVIRDVAVISTIEANPCLPAFRRPGHRKPRDVHVIRGHLKDMITRALCPNRGRIVTVLWLNRQSLVHIHVLGVCAIFHANCISFICVINRMLYRRIAGIKRTAVSPPAGCIHANIAVAAGAYLPLQVWIGYTPYYYSPDVIEIPLIHRRVSTVVPIIWFPIENIFTSATTA